MEQTKCQGSMLAVYLYQSILFLVSPIPTMTFHYVCEWTFM